MRIDELLARLEAEKELTESRFKATEDAMRTALAAAKEAVVKAETATERRFDSVNEFRMSLSDQAGHFATKEALESFAREGRTANESISKDIIRSIDVAAKALEDQAVRNRAQHAELSDRITAVTSSLSNYGARAAERSESIKAAQWTFGIVLTLVNVAALFVFHYLK